MKSVYTIFIFHILVLVAQSTIQKSKLQNVTNLIQQNSPSNHDNVQNLKFELNNVNHSTKLVRHPRQADYSNEYSDKNGDYEDTTSMEPNPSSGRVREYFNYDLDDEDKDRNEGEPEIDQDEIITDTDQIVGDYGEGGEPEPEPISSRHLMRDHRRRGSGRRRRHKVYGRHRGYRGNRGHRGYRGHRKYRGHRGYMGYRGNRRHRRRGHRRNQFQNQQIQRQQIPRQLIQRQQQQILGQQQQIQGQQQQIQKATLAADTDQSALSEPPTDDQVNENQEQALPNELTISEPPFESQNEHLPEIDQEEVEHEMDTEEAEPEMDQEEVEPEMDTEEAEPEMDQEEAEPEMDQEEDVTETGEKIEDSKDIGEPEPKSISSRWPFGGHRRRRRRRRRGHRRWGRGRKGSWDNWKDKKRREQEARRQGIQNAPAPEKYSDPTNTKYSDPTYNQSPIDGQVNKNQFQPEINTGEMGNVQEPQYPDY